MHTSHTPPPEAFHYARLSNTLDLTENRAPALAPHDDIWRRIAVISSNPPKPSVMMAPATDPFWIDVVYAMRERQDRVGKACLILAITIFLMIAGRVAWTYAAGLV